jgi:hypothetical protein
MSVGPEAVENVTPSVDHLFCGSPYPTTMGQFLGIAPDRPQGGLVHRDSLGLCQGLELCGTAVVQPVDLAL